MHARIIVSPDHLNRSTISAQSIDTNIAVLVDGCDLTAHSTRKVERYSRAFVGSHQPTPNLARSPTSIFEIYLDAIPHRKLAKLRTIHAHLCERIIFRLE